MTYLFYLKEYDKALADADKCIELNPKADVAYEMRGTCYEMLGEKEKSNADHQKATELGFKRRKS